MQQVPTLLIGLGGIGSTVVDQISGWLTPDKRAKISLHAFDTNVNDIGKLKHLKGRITQTSAKLTVEGYLHQSDSSVKEWFPFECRVLLPKTLTDGAGQIRVVSRLAYRAALEWGKIKDFEVQVTRMFRESGEKFDSGIRVMIVSSLVGGTGSGIFLQVAMYVRELFERNFSREDVLIRGAFLLPDCFIKTGWLDKEEHDNVRANAYAALKELDAILRISSGYEQNLATIELEYRPGQRDLHGQVNYAITEKQRPFDYLFLYDFENTDGNNLAHFDNYLNQVSKTIFLQLFSPMSPEHFSVEDNQILNLIRNQGRSRYGGAGVASVVYPFDDIVNYCALRWSTESLTDSWLKLDEEYQEEIRSYERDLNDGLVRSRPKLPERYVWILENFAKETAANPFFKEIYRSTRIINREENYDRGKATLFLEAVDREIERIVNADKGIQEIENECIVDEGLLGNKDHALSEVSRVEDSLFYLQQKVINAVTEYSNFLINQVVLRDCDVPGNVGKHDYRLNTWILAKPDPMHPVAVRYFLYQLYLKINEELQTLRAQNHKLLNNIENYQKAYDLPETEDIETAEDRVRMALEQGFFKSLFHNQFKEFKKLYEEKSRRQLNNLKRYKISKLKELVYGGVLDSVNEMLEDWERYFRHLRDVKNTLANEMNIIARKHEDYSDPTVIYVLGRKEDKERIWNEIRINLARNTLPEEIVKRIYLGHYKRFCRRRHREYVTTEKMEEVEKIFREDVVSWCARELREETKLNRNVFSALKMEAQYKEEDNIGEYIKNKIDQINITAKPFVPEILGARWISFWGIHPDSIRELTDEETHTFFGGELIEDDAFSPYEVIRYRSQYGMTVFDFPKFSAGDSSRGISAGEYYKSYMERIRDLDTNPDTITPHLDKRWHKEAYLPDLNPKKTAERKQEIDRAFILGLILDYLKIAQGDQLRYWVFQGDDRVSPIIKDSRKVKPKLHMVHKALYYNPGIVDQILGMYENQKEKDKNTYGDSIGEHKFYKGCQNIKLGSKPENILNLLLRYPDEDPGIDNIYNDSYNLLDLLLDEICDYYIFVFGKQRENTAKKAFRELVNDLIQASETYNNADPTSEQYIQWKNIIFQN